MIRHRLVLLKPLPLKESAIGKAARAWFLTRVLYRLSAILAIGIAFSILIPAGATPIQASGIRTSQESSDGPTVSPKARALHNSSIVIDTHEDTPQRFVDEGFDLGSVTPVSEGSTDLLKIREGNLTGLFFSIWVDPHGFQGQYAHRALDLIDSVYQQAARHPGQMRLALTPADIIEAHAQGKLAALMGLEGGHAIENRIGLLRDYYRLGVRYMTLTHTTTNEWADSSGDIADDKIPHHSGLTEFGKEVVGEMNRLGMMVDVSHVSDKTFWDVIATTKAPIIASHSSARALSRSPRNLSDDMLRAIARNRGVVMVNFYSAFVDENFRMQETEQASKRNAAIAAEVDKWKLQHPGELVPYFVGGRVEKEWISRLPRPTFDKLIDQFDYVAKVAGVDHVGIGSDFDGITSSPFGMQSVADLPKITQGLLDRGYTPVQIRKILGGNILRVFREVDQVAGRMQKQSQNNQPER